MLKKIGKGILITLAVLGVLFIILMLLPEDEESDSSETVIVEEESAYTEETTVTAEAVPETEEAETQTEEKLDENAATVSIPQSEISDRSLRFTTVTLDDKTVTEDIFKDYDLTLVHVWGTFCSPCIAEMGDYAALEKELPSNVNIIGIVNDVYDGLDYNVYAAQDILKNAGATFTNLKVSDDIYSVTSSLQYVPSSFFVDKEGHIVGSMMDGAHFSDTKERLYSYIK